METENEAKVSTILCFLGHYLPGDKSGGPVRTIANMVHHLSPEFDFAIVTMDRDLGDRRPYKGIKRNTWTTVEGTRVFYASPNYLTAQNVRRIMSQTSYDLIYLNSLFNFRFTNLPLISRPRGKPVLLAPRGELSPGALELKSLKKRTFLLLARLVGLHDNIAWQASSVIEASHIRATFGNNVRIFTATNLPPKELAAPARFRLKAAPPSPLRIVFVSRISPMKNLVFALRTLYKVRVPVSFSIYGPNPESEYWRKCEKLIREAPSHLRISYHGPISHSEVPKVLADHDLFFLPTLGENYGHAIAEAISIGTPVLISDRTPWRGLASDQLGWDIPLSDQVAFVRAIEHAASLTPEDRKSWRIRVQEQAQIRLDADSAIEQNREMFRSLINDRRS